MDPAVHAKKARGMCILKLMSFGRTRLVEPDWSNQWIEAISKAATGKGGERKISISEFEVAWKIRTGERDATALLDW
jgi:nitrogen regulatory protein PII